MFLSSHFVDFRIYRVHSALMTSIGTTVFLWWMFCLHIWSFAVSSITTPFSCTCTFLRRMFPWARIYDSFTYRSTTVPVFFSVVVIPFPIFKFSSTLSSLKPIRVADCVEVHILYRSDPRTLVYAPTSDIHRERSFLSLPGSKTIISGFTATVHICCTFCSNLVWFKNACIWKLFKVLVWKATLISFEKISNSVGLSTF